MDLIGVALLCFGVASFGGGLVLGLTDGGTMARSARNTSREMRRLGLGFTVLGVIALCLGLIVP